MGASPPKNSKPLPPAQADRGFLENCGPSTNRARMHEYARPQARKSDLSRHRPRRPARKPPTKSGTKREGSRVEFLDPLRSRFNF